MPKKLLYSAVFDGQYPFAPLFRDVVTVEDPDRMTAKDSVLIIWGGGDISPTLYGHGVSARTHGTDIPSNRDLIEWDLARTAVREGIPIIGICRGAQMMCAMSKGSLIQDITGHHQSHEIEVLKTNETMITSSLHHQMMFPWNIEHKMIAVSRPTRSNHYITRPKEAKEDVYVTDVPCEPEIIWFPQTKSLCIQGHPEFLGVQSRFVQFCFELVSTYVL
jgi:GMP synthase-like glutamine amidotransferase